MERHGRHVRRVAHQGRAERRARGGGEAPHRIARARVQALAVWGLIRERLAKEMEVSEMNARPVCEVDASLARRIACMVARRMGGAAKRETRGGGR